MSSCEPPKREMPRPAGFKFRAFLSYSHRDRAFAEWLHRRLENYRIPKELIGQQQASSTIPKSLRPIFRDREDFAAGASLSGQSTEAMEASQFLIVICSPNAAKSAYVNEEIRRFKAMGRGGRVLAVIIDGEPGAGDAECFPPALRFKLDAAGALTSEAEEPIAADARPIGDGKELALLKIIAGLLEMPLGELRNREAIATRRRRRLRLGVAAAFASLVMLATASAVLAYNKIIESDERIEQAVEFAYGFLGEAVQMSNRLGVPFELTVAVLERAERVLDGLIAEGKNSPSLRHRKALMSLNFALSYRRLGQTATAKARAEEAQASLRTLAGEHPDRLAWQRDFGISYGVLGDLLQDQGNLAAALANYRAGLVLAERLVAIDPANAMWRNDLSILRVAIADVLAAQGQLEAALAHYRAELAGHEQWLELLRKNASPESDPSWPRVQHGMALSHERIGATLSRRGKHAEAVEHLRAGLAIMERLAGADAENVTWQLSLASIRLNLGDALSSLGQHDAALAAYEAALPIREKLAAAEPKNARWQAGLATLQDRIGGILHRRSELDAALARFRSALAVRQRLARSDPDNVQWQFDLSESHNSIADVLEDKNERASALAERRRRHALLEQLAARDPTNADWQQNLSHNLQKIGNLLAALGRWADALQVYRDGLRIAQLLSARDPSNREWRRGVAILLMAIGRVQTHDQDLGLALASYNEARAIIEQLASDPADHDAQRALELLHNRLGDLLAAQGKIAAAVENYRQAFAIAARLAEKDEGNILWQRDLGFCYRRLARMLWVAGAETEAVRLLREGRAKLAAVYARAPQVTVLADEIEEFDSMLRMLEGRAPRIAE